MLIRQYLFLLSSSPILTWCRKLVTVQLPIVLIHMVSAFNFHFLCVQLTSSRIPSTWCQIQLHRWLWPLTKSVLHIRIKEDIHHLV